MKSKIHFYALIGSLVVFLLALLPLLVNIKLFIHGCFYTFDYAIFQQFANGLANFESFNPFSTIRNLGLYNDHVSAILMLLVPFVRLSAFHPMTLLFCEWAFYFSTLVILFSLFRKNRKTFAYILALFLFHKAGLVGLYYPVHPDIWSVPLWVIWVWAITYQKKGWIVLIPLFLCGFKESYPFCVLTLSGYYFYRQEKKVAYSLLTIALGWFCFNYYGRSALFGPIFPYGIEDLARLKASPLLTLKELWALFPLKELIKFWGPLLFGLGWVAVYHRLHLLQSLLPVTIMMAPLFPIHFLANKWFHHYAAVLTIPFLMVLFLSRFPRAVEEGGASKRVKIITLALFVITSTHLYQKALTILLTEKHNGCALTSESRKSLYQLLEVVERESQKMEGKKIFSTQGVHPYLIAPGRFIYGDNIRLPLHEYPQFDILLLERGGSRDTYPHSREEVEKMVKECSPYAKSIWVDNSDFYFVEGAFPQKCLIFKHAR